MPGDILENAWEESLEENFVGVSDYYPPESEVSYLELEYSPEQLVVKNKSPSRDNEIRNEIGYDEDFGVEAVREYHDGALHEDLSDEEIDRREERGILHHYVSRDPRYVVATAEDVEQIGDEAFRVTTIDDELPDGRKVENFSEIYLEDGRFDRMVNMDFLAGEELDSNREEITFDYGQ